MMTQGKRRVLFGCLLTLIFTVFIAGCGGSGDSTPSGTGISADVFTIQAGSVPIKAVRVGETATLDGSNSNTTSSAPLSFAWSFNYKPYGSNAELENAATEAPSFVADVAGTYLVQLKVSAGGLSARDVATVLVTEPDENGVYPPPTGPWNHPGLSSHCAEQCHEGPNRTANPKSGDHIATSNMCQACHSTFAFKPAPFVDHLEVAGNCSECHNGLLAIGKSEFHTQTNAECDDCHNTTSFVELEPDGSFDHSGIERACSACHGRVAIGKHENHIPTSTDCGYCHTTDSFVPSFAGSVDHSVIHSDCARSGCHSSTAWPEIHPVTSLDCVICHNVRTFVIDGAFNHRFVDPLTQRCDSCHDGVISTGTDAYNLTHNGDDHPATNGADCGACHSAANVPGTGLPSFTNAVFDHTDADLSDCGASGCHDANSVTGAYARNTAIHVPTNGHDCHLCHNPGDSSQGTGSFVYGVFDHTAVEADLNTRCDSCHNDGVTAGKAADHIPVPIVNNLEQDCRGCHGTETFADATVDHSTINSGCATCHNTVIATGKPTGTGAHVPTDVDCSACHTATDPVAANNAFAPATQYDHANLSQRCDTCHSGTYANVPGKARRSNPPVVAHIPAQDDCGVCHSTGDTFNPAINFQHPGYTGGGCEGCHNGRFTTATPSILSKLNSSKTNGHLPTAQDCDTCHANTNDWSQLKAPYLQHAGITRDCYTCHNINGSYAENGALGVADDPDTPEPHPQITVSNGVHNPDCVACHSAPSVRNQTVDFTTHFVDHSAITNGCTNNGCHSVELAIANDKSQHPSPTDGNDCETCHVGGGTWSEAVFAHTPEQLANKTCVSCHNGIGATGQPQGHVPTTPDQDCRLCHNTEAFAGAAFNHQGIDSGCVDCHNGDTATGKHNNHVPTNEDCGVCHRTTGFVPGLFAHTRAQISGVDCKSCHNGTFATGKADKTGTPHVDTLLDCGSCHGTDTFADGIFDHSNIGNQSCSSCHNGRDATGQPTTGHIDSAGYGLDCDRCHTAGGSFIGVTFDHNNIGQIGNGTCQQCHSSGGGATEQPPAGTNGHFDTTVDCDACHTTSGWGDQGTFDHCPNTASRSPNFNQCGDYPGDHVNSSGQPKIACIDCHTTNRASYIYYSYDERNGTSYGPTCAGCHANRYSGADEHNRGGVSANLECGNSCHNRHHTVEKSRFN